jgi:hypothetical protein
VLRQAVEKAGDRLRAARASDDDVDAREHGAVGRRHERQRDLHQEVDADRVAGGQRLREEHLDEPGHDLQLDGRGMRCERGQGQPTVRGAELPAPLDEETLLDPAGDVGVWKGGEREANVASHIAVLESAGDHEVERGARHHAELARRRHGAGQLPAGDADPHASLNDPRLGDEWS